MNPEQLIEHPDWKPWWVRRADYGGRFLVLIDVAMQGKMKRLGHIPCGHYALGFGPVACTTPECPEYGSGDPHAVIASWHDDEAEAVAAFHRAEQELIAVTLMEAG